MSALRPHIEARSSIRYLKKSVCPHSYSVCVLAIHCSPLLPAHLAAMPPSTPSHRFGDAPHWKRAQRVARGFAHAATAHGRRKRGVRTWWAFGWGLENGETRSIMSGKAAARAQVSRAVARAQPIPPPPLPPRRAYAR